MLIAFDVDVPLLLPVMQELDGSDDDVVALPLVGIDN
jgi:hypothetical protein